jgi:hypothetical protein
MKQTAVEWLIEQLPLIQQEGLRDVIEQAKEMEKEQMEEIREMLVQGALTNMSCASAVVEFDRLTKQQEQ